MTNINYQDAIYSYYTDKVKQAIKEQDDMMNELAIKQSKYEELKSKVIDLYITGFERFKEKGYILPLNLENKGRFEIGEQIINLFLNQNEKYQKVLSYMNDIQEIKEAGSLEQKLYDIELDFYKSFIKYNNKVNEDRDRVFSKEYKNIIFDYSKKGWFFNYLASPDLPLLHEFCDEEYLCNTFTYNNCINIKLLLSNMLNQDNPSPAMKRKIIDINSVIHSINNRSYRSAARTLFSLLESESKNCSNSFRIIENKKGNLRTGKERAQEIERLTKTLNIEWYKNTWGQINNYYKKTTSNKIYPGIINRNGLIHGDYYEDYMDVNLKDVLKLFILWVNYRTISDYIQYIYELESDLMQYSMIGLAHIISRKKKSY